MAFLASINAAKGKMEKRKVNAQLLTVSQRMRNKNRNENEKIRGNQPTGPFWWLLPSFVATLIIARDVFCIHVPFLLFFVGCCAAEIDR
jgi:hypothetical protein